MENIKEKIRKKLNKENIFILCALIIIAILISIQSCASIFNTTDYLQIDVSVWTCVVKKMQSGQTIYKDIFDHKGPILYLFYYLGYLFAGIKGIGLLDFITTFIETVLVYKIARKLNLNKTISFLVVTLFMAFYSYLCLENPCAESLAMPFILLAQYYFIEFIINQEKFYIKESIITGLCLGIVLMIRPNLAALWLVYDLFIFFKMLKDKKFKKLIYIILFSFLGLFIALIPIILYLYFKNSLSDFFSTYIIFNFKYMGAIETTIEQTLTKLIDNSGGLIPIIILIQLGMLFIIKVEKKEEKTLIITNLIYTVINIYLAVQPQKANIHYLIPVTSNLTIPFVLILRKIDIKNEFIKFLIFIIGITIININMDKTYKKWKDIYSPAAKVVQEITNPGDDVLQIGNKPGIYLSSDRMYSGKFFFQIPVAYYDEEVEKEFIEELKRVKPKLIIDLVVDWENIENHSELGYKFRKDLAEVIKKDYYYLDGRLYLRIEDN